MRLNSDSTEITKFSDKIQLLKVTNIINLETGAIVSLSCDRTGQEGREDWQHDVDIEGKGRLLKIQYRFCLKLKTRMRLLCLQTFCFIISYKRGRMSRGGHGLLKVSPGPALSYPSTPHGHAWAGYGVALPFDTPRRKTMLMSHTMSADVIVAKLRSSYVKVFQTNQI
jgi:hypothetical protein